MVSPLAVGVVGKDSGPVRFNVFMGNPRRKLHPIPAGIIAPDGGHVYVNADLIRGK